jgi:hypothetical protein
MIFSIYTLSCPLTKEVKYVGKIKKFMHERNEVITKINEEHE